MYIFVSPTWHRLSLFAYSICFNWNFFFTIEIKNSFELPSIISNVTVVLLKRGFHLSHPTAPGNTEEENRSIVASKTWVRTLDPDLKNLDPEKTGSWKTWNVKNLDQEKPGPWKNWTRKNLDPEKTWIIKNLDQKKSEPWKIWTKKNLDPEKTELWPADAKIAGWKKMIRRPHSLISITLEIC